MKTGSVRFGRFELDPQREELRRDGVVVHIAPQPFRLLALLVEREGELVTREELRDLLGGASAAGVTDDSLAFCVRQVRRALDDDVRAPRYVQTLPRRGLCFIAPVVRRPASPTAGATRVAPPARRLRGARAASVVLVALVALLALVASRPRWRAAGPERPVVLVLPFDNLTGDPLQDALGRALADEVITALAGAAPARLAVVARTSAEAYKQRGGSLTDVGRLAGATHVVEGAVGRDGGRLRVNARLVRVSDGERVWAASFDRDGADLLALQAGLARAVVAALDARLAAPTSPLPEIAPAAREHYVAGRYKLQMRSAEAQDEARAAFERALSIQPDCAPALAGLAEAWLGLGMGSRAPREALPHARLAAEAALRIDPHSASAHRTLAIVRLHFDYDQAGAREAFEQAVRLAPGDAATHHARAALEAVAGRHERALFAIAQAELLDPLNSDVLFDGGFYAYLARRNDEAVQRLEKARRLEPRLGYIGLQLAFAHASAGRLDAASRALIDMARVEGVPPERLALLARLAPGEVVQRVMGSGVRNLEHALQRGRFLSADNFYPRYALLGERQAALDWLERALDERSFWLLPLVAADPLLDGLRSEPRFRAVARRVGLQS